VTGQLPGVTPPVPANPVGEHRSARGFAVAGNKSRYPSGSGEQHLCSKIFLNFARAMKSIPYLFLMNNSQPGQQFFLKYSFVSFQDFKTKNKNVVYKFIIFVKTLKMLKLEQI